MSETFNKLQMSWGWVWVKHFIFSFVSFQFYIVVSPYTSMRIFLFLSKTKNHLNPNHPSIEKRKSKDLSRNKCVNLIIFLSMFFFFFFAVPAQQPATIAEKFISNSNHQNKSNKLENNLVDEMNDGQRIFIFILPNWPNEYSINVFDEFTYFAGWMRF